MKGCDDEGSIGAVGCFESYGLTKVRFRKTPKPAGETRVLAKQNCG